MNRSTLLICLVVATFLFTAISPAMGDTCLVCGGDGEIEVEYNYQVTNDEGELLGV